MHEKCHRPKLCGNCAFPQNFHTRKLGEITVFYAVFITKAAQLFDMTQILQSWKYITKLHGTTLFIPHI